MTQNITLQPHLNSTLTSRNKSIFKFVEIFDVFPIKKKMNP